MCISVSGREVELGLIALELRAGDMLNEEVGKIVVCRNVVHRNVVLLDVVMDESVLDGNCWNRTCVVE